jgi:hypothetical protein
VLANLPETATRVDGRNEKPAICGDRAMLRAQARLFILAFIVSSYSPTLTELARPRNNPKAYVVLTVEDTLQIIAKVDKRKFKP